jgi:hypothetical protein
MFQVGLLLPLVTFTDSREVVNETMAIRRHIMHG